VAPLTLDYQSRVVLTRSIANFVLFYLILAVSTLCSHCSSPVCLSPSLYLTVFRSPYVSLKTETRSWSHEVVLPTSHRWRTRLLFNTPICGCGWFFLYLLIVLILNLPIAIATDLQRLHFLVWEEPQECYDVMMWRGAVLVLSLSFHIYSSNLGTRTMLWLCLIFWLQQYAEYNGGILTQTFLLNILTTIWSRSLGRLGN
jgi:hypothetical protein